MLNDELKKMRLIDNCKCFDIDNNEELVLNEEELMDVDMECESSSELQSIILVENRSHNCSYKAYTFLNHVTNNNIQRKFNFAGKLSKPNAHKYAKF